MTRSSIPLVAFALATCLGFDGSLRAQDSALSAKATAMFNAGRDAAGRGDWPAAIRQFSQAQSIAPLSPPILFNLGFANAKAGNDIVSILWLEAYLSAQTDADNAPPVRAEIERLKKEARRKLEDIVRAATALALKTSPYTIREIAELQASAGDMDGALATLKLREGPADAPWFAYVNGLLAACEGVPAAESAARRIADAKVADSAWETISNKSLSCEDPARAARAAEQMVDGARRQQVLARANASLVRQRVSARVAAGDVALHTLREAASVEYGEWIVGSAASGEAERGNFESATRIARALLEGERRAEALGAIGAAQRRRGRGVDPSIVSELRGFVAPAVAGGKDSVLQTIARKQLEIGDNDGAEATARELLRLKYEFERYGDVLANAILRRYDAALALAAGAKTSAFNPTSREARYGDIAFVQAIRDERALLERTVTDARTRLPSLGDYNARLRANARVPTEYRLGLVESNIAEVQLSRGQAHDAVETLLSAENWTPRAEGLAVAAVETALLRGQIAQALQDAVRIFERGAVSTNLLKLIAASTVDYDRVAIQSFARDSRQALARQPEAAYANRITEALREIAALQTRAGDPAGAAATLGTIAPVRWIALARRAASEEKLADTARALERAASLDYENKPADTSAIPRQVADVGRMYAYYLQQIYTLEAQYAPQSKQ